MADAIKNQESTYKADKLIPASEIQKISETKRTFNAHNIYRIFFAEL